MSAAGLRAAAEQLAADPMDAVMPVTVVKMRSAVCEKCGAEFEASPFGDLPKLCRKCAHESAARTPMLSPQAREAMAAKKEARIEAGKPPRTSVCMDCGCEFEAKPVGIIPKRCPECRAKVMQAQKNEWARKHKPAKKPAKPAPKPAPAKAEAPKLSADALDAAARRVPMWRERDVAAATLRGAKVGDETDELFLLWLRGVVGLPMAATLEQLCERLADLIDGGAPDGR